MKYFSNRMKLRRAVTPEGIRDHVFALRYINAYVNMDVYIFFHPKMEFVFLKVNMSTAI